MCSDYVGVPEDFAKHWDISNKVHPAGGWAPSRSNFMHGMSHNRTTDTATVVGARALLLMSLGSSSCGRTLPRKQTAK